MTFGRSAAQQRQLCCGVTVSRPKEASTVALASSRGYRSAPGLESIPSTL